MNLNLGSLGQISRSVKDIAQSEAWYKTVLGLPHLFTFGKLAFFDCGGVRLMLSRAEKPEFDHPSSVLYFSVPDIAAAHRQMQSAGVHFEAAPHFIAALPTHDLWMGFFRDSEHNLLALMSEVSRGA